jgi:NADH-quinone oxidoreductase E subunit
MEREDEGMLVTQQQEVRIMLEALADKHGRDRAALIPILQEVQKRRGRVGAFTMQELADMLNIHPAEVYGVVSFYSFLDSRKKGQFIIRLCQTISCDMVGKSDVARQLENDLGIKFGETTADGYFTLEYASCLGLCDQGPALLVNDKVYTQVTPEQVDEILEECRRTFGAYALQAKKEELK